ncbi:MaoC family dehydratase [Pigmentiphaga soli]|uniref:MaoC family dehydratase n=1 Tax=Pigmentiphaga soli TaxID=1007095 RepID=A0ABP8GCB9_9BURK
MTTGKISRTIPQTQEMFDDYGRLNGDNDILHYDDAFAKARGFRGTLGHGLMYTGYVCDLAARKYGPEWLSRGRLTVKYVRGVCPGDRLEVSLDEDGTVQCESQYEVTLVGRATLAG